MSDLRAWFKTPPGQVALDWEQRACDAALVDLFGYHALQVGAPELAALARNRMPQRWLSVTAASDNEREILACAQDAPAIALAAASVALPFDEASLDLVVLPHTLESSPDPHAALREVHRVLVHEGRVAIIGFNPLGAWAWRQTRARWWRRVGAGRLYLPDAGRAIGMGRLKDWLALLGFEIEDITYGCYEPALRGAGALRRFAWTNRVGARWWPVLGSLYFVLAAKRSAGARLIGPAWKRTPQKVGAPASIARRQAPPDHTWNHTHETD